MSYVAVRREEEKERRRAEMVDAAEALYAKVGWDAVTMDRVARSARLSRALLYVYFRDKNDLLHAITERALHDLRERFVAAAGAHAKGVDKIEAIGRSYVQFQKEKPYRFDACAAAGDAVMAVIVAALHQGQADGSIRKDIGDPMQVCIMLWAFTHGLIQIATNKSVEIEHHGVDVTQLMEGSFGMLRFMLGGKAGA